MRRIFIALDGENYYNFEFSCIGTTHLAWGPGRHNRKFVDPDIIKKLEIKSSLGDQPFGVKTGNFSWEIMVRIPMECFAFSNLSTFKGLKAKANFFKCGDETRSHISLPGTRLKRLTLIIIAQSFLGKYFLNKQLKFNCKTS